MEHSTSATSQHEFPGGFPTGPDQHHHCTIELLLLFLIVYTGHFNCTWGGGAVLLCHMNSVIILNNHESCTYRRRRRRRRRRYSLCGTLFVLSDCNNIRVHRGQNQNRLDRRLFLSHFRQIGSETGQKFVQVHFILSYNVGILSIYHGSVILK
jgi:hypothetical protein